MNIQDEVTAFLADPATHGGETPQCLETHISRVFLANGRAWKMKKAVNLSFLDFSTLEQRHQACETELAVNLGAAPDLYLGLVAVTRDRDGTLHLGGEGETVEWLVSMRRFAQDDLLSARLRAGQVERKAIQSVAEAVWQAHAAAPHRPDRDNVANLGWTIDTNAAAMDRYPQALDPAKAALLAQASHALLARHAPLLQRRRQDGKLRWCHGDLHCGNICLYQGRPTLFDAIEFSENIACIDVFYDLAFLLMDLDQRGERALASHALNHYLDLSGDYQGAILLPLFLSLRAAIRAHVAAAMGQPEQAATYLDAAIAYLTPPPARLLAVGGLSGSGKSRMGRELAPFLGMPGAVVIRSDAVRKQLWNCPLHEKLPAQAYQGDWGRRTYQALYQIARDLLAAGCPVVADAVFAKPEQRAAIQVVAEDAGVAFDGLWLWTEPETALARIETRTTNASDADQDVLRHQLKQDLGPMSWVKIHTGDSKEAALASGRAALCL